MTALVIIGIVVLYLLVGVAATTVVVALFYSDSDLDNREGEALWFTGGVAVLWPIVLAILVVVGVCCFVPGLAIASLKFSKVLRKTKFVKRVRARNAKSA